MANLPIHRCEDKNCPSFGQTTDRGCGCHKTIYQMLVEQRDELLASLKLVRNWGRIEDLSQSEVAAIDAAIAKAESA